MHGTSGGVPVNLSGYGGLVTLARPESVPEGASPRTYDTDFLVGSVHSRAGLVSQYAFEGVTTTANPGGLALGATWTTPGNILLNDGSTASQQPSVSSGPLDITEFAFDLPSTVTPTGVQIVLKGYTNSSAAVGVQLLINGVPTGFTETILFPSTLGPVTYGGFTNLFGTGAIYSDINNTQFGIRITASSAFPLAVVYLEYATVQIALTVANANFNFITTFTAQNGDVKNLALDANGNLWLEDVTNNPGFLNLVRENITPNSYIKEGVNGPDVEYLAFTDGTTGSDLPLQYTPRWIDRITQVGPGAAPTFTPGQASTNNYPILTITQFPPNSDITDPGFLSCLLQSAGPGSTSPGNIITVYYSPGFFGGSPHPEAEDQNLVKQFNSGVPVYVYLSGTPFGQGTYLVTSIGNALPPGLDHFRYYFTVQANNISFENIVEAAGQYQLSVGTVTTSVPVPGLQAGNNVTITGNSVPAWDSTWGVVRTLNSAAMVITQTSVTASVATYNYSISSGAPPLVGQLVTVTGTTNANGALNVTNATITAASGGTSGTFSVAVSVVTAASVPEDGLATTAGTQFEIDPGIITLGTGASPIFGNGTGGTLTFIPASAQLIGPGTRQGTVFFITRNGYFTAPAPPVTFTCPENTTSIQVSQIPVGPPNVIARGISLTEPGQNGVPGANFFTLPTPVDYVVDNQTFTASSFYLNDNTSTTMTLNFTDSILLSALAIDVYGYNLFNQIEIGDPGWITSYTGRNFYGLCRNKIQNFLNMSFDGGYLPTQGQNFPLGWTTPDSYGQLIISPRFGNAYYIKNTTSGTLAVAGLISQSAFEDANKIPILNSNTAYSVRIAARIPSGNHTGNLVVTLTSSGAILGSFTLPFASMTTNYAIYEGTLLTTPFTTVPSDLLLNLSASNIAAGADVEIDRFDVFDTAIPVLGTTVYGSYAGLPEQVDAVTGKVVFESENIQPVNGARVMYDTFYALKAWQGHAVGASMYSLQASANLEPAQWTEPEVAQKCGAIGVLAYDFGEQWLVMANRLGLYLFEGGQPGKISQEIVQVWDSIYWLSADKIWVLNDSDRRRLFVGVPMATPNFWLPNAPVNATPSSPNVILMLNYQGLDSGQMLKSEPQMHTTMFGTLNAIDMRRKWSIWQIASPYGAICQANIGMFAPPTPPPPPPVITIPAPPPPFAPPVGQSVAFAIATANTGDVSFSNGPAFFNSGSAIATNTTGSLGTSSGSPMPPNSVGIQWSAAILSNEVPAGASIVGIYPYAVLTDLSLGGDMSIVSNGAGNFGIALGPNFGRTIGTSLTGEAITAHVGNSLDGGGAILGMTMSFVGWAIYYASTTSTVATTISINGPAPPPPPPPAFISTAQDEVIYICNGLQNSKIYSLEELAETDDGRIIDSLYTTAGLVEMTKRTQNPALGWGRMRFGWMNAFLESLGLVNVRLLPNTLLGPTDPTTGYNAWTLPGGFTPGNPAMNDSEAPLNFAATRTYVEFRENDGHGFSLSNLVLHAKKDVWNTLRGAK